MVESHNNLTHLFIIILFKFIKHILLICLLVTLFLTNAQAQSSLAMSAQAGRMIHDATFLPQPDYWPTDWPWDGEGLNTKTSYRYGPALVRSGTQSLHFWACSEGDSGVADYIRYKYTPDGGKTWHDGPNNRYDADNPYDPDKANETIALAPTIGSEDGWAVCDPHVIKVGSYYYMAYTATDNAYGAGLNNHVFVARSTQPHKNYQKWNGSGWGGNPKPVLRYTGITNKWGLGEPNMVVKGTTLYLYYTEDQGVAKTRVATTSITDVNWPAKLAQRGYAIEKRNWAEDQTDVKYLPQVNRFIATATANRFSANSYVHVWQSTDGLRFSPVSNDRVKTNLQITAHNLGMSGNFLGHAQMGNSEYIAYGYTGPDGEWGRWNTWLNKVNITGAGWIPTKDKPNLNSILMLILD